MAAMKIISLFVVVVIAFAIANPAAPQQRQPVNSADDLSAGPESDLRGSSSYGYGYYGGGGYGGGGYGGYPYGGYSGYGGYGGYPYYSRYYSAYPYFRGYGVGGLYGGLY